ncbi:uncharacterized protein LOC130387896 [Gadus chalcogrammus]|uniref:uncharacterized protein LOC130387896 n=1 Tax=Gadus chalcogrammus TaxID=1042646 RepID=UPI0024C4CF0D|nr:uncharacterized protein LOC130387896 [Gadus chalcogrammus]
MDVTEDSMNVHHREDDGTVYFETYVPPARDAIYLPKHVLYLLMGSFMVVGVLYAIIGHLIKDLIHDFADWLFGEQPEELVVNFCEAKDKFMADWCPETSPELEAMARAEQIKVVLEANEYSPAIWIISDGVEPKPARKGPRVAFGAKS